MNTITCAICGDPMTDKFVHKLKCEHEFHYECLMKSFGTYNIEKNRNCPYCRKPTVYLPLVNGLKKVTPGVHCSIHNLKKKKKKN